MATGSSASDTAKLRVSQKSLTSAKRCLQCENHGRAFAHFLLVLKLQPELKEIIKADFEVTCEKWFRELANKNRIDDLMNCFDGAVELFPECQDILSRTGSLLFGMDLMAEAASCFEKVLKANPDCLSVRDNLENVYSHMVERWHYRMLNDKFRNQSYNHAIWTGISKGHQSVLDIGTGSGLLSMFARDASAINDEKINIYACEMSKPMYHVAQKVFAANKMTEDIHLLHTKSNDIVIGRDMPERVSLIITETIDAGLVGEHILSSLNHAWHNLLDTSTTAKIAPCVIPAAATVYAMVVECDYIRKQNRLLYPALREIDLSTLSIVCKTSLEAEEPYTTEKLSTIPGGYKQLTREFEVFQINFNDHKSIKKHLAGLHRDIPIKVIQSGRADAVIMSFDLDLDDVTTLSSKNAESCWEQAVYPCLHQHLRLSNTDQVENFMLKTNEAVVISCHCANNSIHLSLSEIIHSSRRGSITNIQYMNIDGASMAENTFQDSTNTSTDTAGSALTDTACTGCAAPSLPPDNIKTYSAITTLIKPYYALERCEISRLNDIHLNAVFCTAIYKLCQRNTSKSQLSLLDMTQGFSALWTQSLKLGLREVCVLDQTTTNQKLTKSIMDLNGLDHKQVRFSSIDDFDSTSTPSFDIVIADLVEACGTLRRNILQEIAYIKYTAMGKSAVIVPDSVAIYGVCIQSDKLEECCCLVDNKRTLGLTIDQFINIYQMSSFVDLELVSLPHTRMTTPVKLLELQFNQPTIEGEIPDYLNQSNQISLSILENGYVHAIVYWFDMKILDNHNLSTLDSNTHWKQAAIVLRQPLAVVEGQMLRTKILCKDSSLDIKLETV